MLRARCTDDRMNLVMEVSRESEHRNSLGFPEEVAPYLNLKDG